MIYLTMPNLVFLVPPTPTPQSQFTSGSGPENLITNPTFIGWITVISLAIGVISILVGVGVSYGLYRKSKQVKLITYEILNETPMMQLQPQPKKGIIKVLYEDAPNHSIKLEKPSFIVLEVKNSGNEDVEIWHAGDRDIQHMEEPIEFEFENRKVITLTEVKTNPLNRINDISFERYVDNPCPTPYRIGLPRFLLRRTESIRLGVVLDGPGKGVKEHGVLYNGDIKSIQDLEKQRGKVTRVIWIAFGSGTVAIVVGLVLLFPSLLLTVGVVTTIISGVGAALSVIASMRIVSRWAIKKSA